MDIIVTMNEYVKKIMVWSEINKTPGKPNNFQGDETPKLTCLTGIRSFPTRVAKLLFVAKRVRPDILLQVRLCSKVKNPSENNKKQLGIC